MKSVKNIVGIILIGALFIISSQPAHALNAAIRNIANTSIKYCTKLGKVDGALPDAKIQEICDRINHAGDISKVGKLLGEMKLSNEVLEDTFMRIIVVQKKISQEEAEKLFCNLRGVEGFRSTLSKAAGISAAKTSGHLNELRIASGASEKGFKVVAIGKKFSDGLKKSPTDIDIILNKNNKTFIIEAKDYGPDTTINMDQFRADMDSLVTFKKQNGKNVIPIFTITNPPSNPNVRKLLEKEAERRGVNLLIGSPDEQIHLINQLGEIV